MSFSPMMTQYLITKEQYKDCILFYRLGDFYELFFDDAEECSELLDLVLTGRECGGDKRAPMCGVPYHSVDTYIAKLIACGKKVAICEQLTQPQSGVLVKRDVVRVITAGTVTSGELLNEKTNNYIACIMNGGNEDFGLAWADITTGDIFVSKVAGLNALNEQLSSILPAEIIAQRSDLALYNSLSSIVSLTIPKAQTYYDSEFTLRSATNAILKQYNIADFSFLGLGNVPNCICAAGALLSYIFDTQKRDLTHLKPIKAVNLMQYMSIDFNTRRNLELTLSAGERKRRGSLLWLIDETRTSMGARLLHNWLERPLQDENEINMRLDAVEEFADNFLLREGLYDTLKHIKDMERIASRVAYNTLSPRDCNALQTSLKAITSIKIIMFECQSQYLVKINSQLSDLPEIVRLIENAIIENAPTHTRDGDFICDKYNSELDNYRYIKRNGKTLIAEIEKNESAVSGIKNLKVGYNKVFGYYFEITNSQLKNVPDHFIRKQTLTNAERYITESLKRLEDEILCAEEMALNLERKLYAEIREKLMKHLTDFQRVAHAIAQLDVLLSFGRVAGKNNYKKPVVSSNTSQLLIEQGRHPIVEEFLSNKNFVRNDTLLDDCENNIMVITGPNMAGKSTYMRQVALIVLLAHIGCFVPALTAKIPIVDKIFTRVGASDDIAFNKSTFSMEMSEVAYILNNATSKSLIVLDEVGRGTSTFDGLSIAWAVLEYIAKQIRAKTLFATHYHELSELEGRIDGIKNFRVTVKESGGELIFLRKIARGSALKSLGIKVAALSGVPKCVTDKATEVLAELEAADIINNQPKKFIPRVKGKNDDEIINILREVNVDKLSPLNAFELLEELKMKAKGEYE